MKTHFFLTSLVALSACLSRPFNNDANTEAIKLTGRASADLTAECELKREANLIVVSVTPKGEKKFSKKYPSATEALKVYFARIETFAKESFVKIEKDIKETEEEIKLYQPIGSNTAALAELNKLKLELKDLKSALERGKANLLELKALLADAKSLKELDSFINVKKDFNLTYFSLGATKNMPDRMIFSEPGEEDMTPYKTTDEVQNPRLILGIRGICADVRQDIKK